MLVLNVLPGTVRRALLLVPRPDSTAHRDPDGSNNLQTDHEATLGLPKGVAELGGLVTTERHPPHRRDRSRPGC